MADKSCVAEEIGFSSGSFALFGFIGSVATSTKGTTPSPEITKVLVVVFASETTSLHDKPRLLQAVFTRLFLSCVSTFHAFLF